MNKLIGAALGLAAGYVVEKMTENLATRVGFNPRAVRIAGVVVGALLS